MTDRFLQKPQVEVTAFIKITEVEARALDALTGYGINPFLEVFYEKMGKHYMKPFESGLRSFFEAVRSEIPQLLHNADRARKAFDEPLRSPKVAIEPVAPPVDAGKREAAP